MLVIELEGNINKMQGEKFIKAYERVSKAKKDGYAISVDISNLDKEEEIER